MTVTPSATIVSSTYDIYVSRSSKYIHCWFKCMGEDFVRVSCFASIWWYQFSPLKKHSLTFSTATTTTTVPPAVTIISTSVISGVEATLTIITTLVQNNKREVYIADPSTRRYNAVERRAGIYPKEVYCGTWTSLRNLLSCLSTIHKRISSWLEFRLREAMLIRSVSSTWRCHRNCCQLDNVST